MNKQENLSKLENSSKQQRMSQELVDDKMQQIHNWIERIEEGELYLNIEETAYTVIDLFEIGECNESCRFNNV